MKTNVYRPDIYDFLRNIIDNDLEKTILDCGAGGKRPPLGLFKEYGLVNHTLWKRWLNYPASTVRVRIFTSCWDWTHFWNCPPGKVIWIFFPFVTSLLWPGQAFPLSLCMTCFKLGSRLVILMIRNCKDMFTPGSTLSIIVR